MKKISYIAAFCFVLLQFVPCDARQKQTVNSQWQEIKENTIRYIAAEGYGATVAEADRNALSALMNSISTNVESSFDMVRVQNGGEEQVNLVQTANSYSSASIRNARRIIIKNEPDAVVGRYVEIKSVNEIFSRRRTLVVNYARYAEEALKKLEIDDALRNFNYARALLATVPDNHTLKYETLDGRTVNALSWLPEQVDAVFDRLSAELLKVKDDFATVQFKYDGSPVSHIQFSYFDGRDLIEHCSAKDGVALLALPSDIDVKSIEIRYEYAFVNEAKKLDEVKDVIDIWNPGTYRNASQYISLSGAGSNRAFKEAMKEASTSVNPGLDYVARDKNYSSIIKKVVSAIRTKEYSQVKDLFTDNGYDMFTKIVNYGKAVIIDDANCKFYKFRDGTVARSIKMSFSFERGAVKTFVEDVVFTFNADDRIDCIAFALGREAYDSVMNHKQWGDTTKMCIVEFLENYKTAYGLKRLSYLQSIFDDDAVIIVGHVAMKTRQMSTDEVKLYTNNPVVTRTRYSKDRYMKNLAACFASNEYVNIRFSSNDIRQYGVGCETFGIQIKQDYFSSNYGDSGFLFLMVDLNDPSAPVIKVRTWQDAACPIDELISVNDF